MRESFVFASCKKQIVSRHGSLLFLCLEQYLSRDTRKMSMGFPTRSDTNRAVQPQKMARCLKFRFKKKEGLYNLCRENKGAEQQYVKIRFSHDAVHILDCFNLRIF